MSYGDFDKLKALYTDLIEIVCTAKESENMNNKVDLLWATFHKVS